ncbi:hypothetical protein MSIMFB_04381 [Mycobacterium simulans]|uniref:Uncharacterized protein n=1 Tax=Mycobacterium simulans TaxID=627089 RepID=A0A7Z7INJ3_9MYCO|nr:hypothetical protein MSIMFB_04381 [Mycobacterium simulans]
MHAFFSGGYDAAAWSTRDPQQRAEFRAARRAQAQAHAAFIRHRVAALVAKDQEISTRIAATTSGIGNLTFQDAPGIDDDAGGDEHRGVQLVDNHTFKDAPHPKPVPPPGGWSSDPLMRAAQKIAYGHASGPDGHMGDFPGMTKDQLAELIYGKLKRSIENPEGLRLVDNHTFKDAPHPKPVPPPGGWSSDPLMRAAQKIAYGHASGPDGHMGDFPGMTKDQLAELIYGKLKRSIENPEGLRLWAQRQRRRPGYL